jgi:uncharacterized protein (TIGR03437 family)
VTEYTVPTAAAGLGAITRGSDGNLWALEVSANKIARITTGGIVTEYTIPTPNARPASITAGPDGNLWFTETSGNKIGRISTSGAVVEYPLPVEFSRPTGIAAGPDGNLWFTEATTIPGTGIGRITTSGQITILALTTSYSLQQITAGPDGNMWFTASNRVGKISSSGAVITYEVETTPEAITLGPDGNLWVTGGSRVVRVTPDGVAESFSAPVTPNGGITFGPDGNLWSIGYGSKLIKLRPDGQFTQYGIPQPGSLVLGPDDNIWVTVPTGNKVVKLDLSTLPADSLFTVSANALTFNAVYHGNRPASQTIVVSPPSAATFTVASTAFWVTVSPSGSLTGNQTLSISVDQNIEATMQYGIPYGAYLWLTSGNVTQTVKVTLYITPPPGSAIVGLQPSAFNFAYKIGSPPPGAGDFVVTHSPLGFVPVTLSYAVSSPTGGHWLILTTTGFNPIPSGSTWRSSVSLRVLVDPTGLPPGFYTATITVVPAGGAPVTAPVTLTVDGSDPGFIRPDIAVTSQFLSFNYFINGAAPPANRIAATAVNPLSGDIPLSVTYEVKSPEGGKWLTLALDNAPFPNGGAASTPVRFDVKADPAGLSPGDYGATITITPAAAQPRTVDVTLRVIADPNATTVSVAPSALDFVWQPGDASPPAQTVQLTETGPPSPFTARSDAAWLAVTPAAGDAAARLAVTVTPAGLSPGIYTGVITITLPKVAGVSTRIAVSLTVRPSVRPVVTAIVNAASFASGPVAPGEIVTLGGTGLGPANTLGLALDSAGKVSTSLGGVSVSFNGYAAPLVYVSPSQINCVVPYEIAGATDVLAQVAFLGQSGTLATKAALVAPAIFTQDGTGSGTAAAANGLGGYNGPANPAPSGSTITFYLTGEGQTTPNGVTGKVTSVDISSATLTPQPLLTPTVTIGGLPAPTLFFGEAPGLVSGILQLNVQIPAGLSAGSAPLVVSFGATATQKGVTVSVR